MTTPIFLHNGVPATDTDLQRVAFAGFAHFTAMQVEDGKVRGLALHLERLRVASDTMFGTHLPDDIVDAHLRRAVAAGPLDASVTIFVASTPPEFEAPSHLPALETFVRVSEPAVPPVDPVSLDIVSRQRDLPEVKHVGEMAKTLYLRRARGRGFDDALSVDTQRNVSEATIWNIAFWDGTQVVWPQAAMLDGITQRIVRDQLSLADISQMTAPVPIDQINPRWSAAIMNSWSPGIAVGRIGETVLNDSTALLDVLHTAFDAMQPDVLHPDQRQ